MSIDLSYPFVPSMGHHDPLDGYRTYSELQATFGSIGGDQPATGPDLHAEIADLAGICAGKEVIHVRADVAKGGKGRVVPVPKRARDALGAYLKVRTKEMGAALFIGR